MHWAYLFIAIIAEVIGTTALKASDGFTRWLPSTITLVAYGIAFYFLSLCLRQIPIGIAYAIWSGIGIAFITLFGWLVYKQTLDTAGFIGIGLIITGVIVINLFSASTH